MEQNNSIQLNVIFEDSFWVAILEREDNSGYSAARKVFGTEPTQVEIYRFILSAMNQLHFSHPDKTQKSKIKLLSPKRRQREAQRQLQDSRLISKAHDAIKKLQEQVKIERKSKSRLKRDEDKDFKFQLKQEKRKAKHRGR